MTAAYCGVGCTRGIGLWIVKQLTTRGVPVRCVARDPVKAQTLLPTGVDIRAGDVTGSVAKFRVGRGWAILREDEMASQAATWNSPAMNFAWARMSLPSMFRTWPFLIIAIAS
jgi:nucleoside-diphosphate-sugar epimerase